VHHKNLEDSKNICHFESAKSEIFNAQSGARREGTWCQISSKSVKLLREYGDFSISQDGSHPPSWICKIGNI